MKFNRLFLTVLTIVFSLILTACAGGATPDESTVTTATEQRDEPANDAELAREDSQGAVTITVTPLNLDNPGDTLDFAVVLDTHSVELDMDLSTLAALTTDTGRTALPVAWTGPSGGHHVEGTLSFPVSVEGSSLLDGASTLTLVIREVDAPERIFEWELGR